jgi:hypothetical protein
LRYSTDGSSQFGNASADVLKILQNDPVTMNNHNWGVSISDFQGLLHPFAVLMSSSVLIRRFALRTGNAKLSSFFTLLATNEDRHGSVFVSAVEGTLPTVPWPWLTDRMQP